MADEIKTYSIIGKVEIGTDEYRDLIEGRLEAEKESDNYRNKYWDKQSEASKLSDKVKALEKTLDEYKKYINSSERRLNDFNQYMVELRFAVEAEEEE